MKLAELHLDPACESDKHSPILLVSFPITYTLIQIQSTLVISNSKGLTEILRDIRTSTYQSWESEENNKLNNHI